VERHSASTTKPRVGGGARRARARLSPRTPLHRSGPVAACPKTRRPSRGRSRCWAMARTCPRRRRSRTSTWRGPAAQSPRSWTPRSCGWSRRSASSIRSWALRIVKTCRPENGSCSTRALRDEACEYGREDLGVVAVLAIRSVDRDVVGDDVKGDAAVAGDRVAGERHRPDLELVVRVRRAEEAVLGEDVPGGGVGGGIGGWDAVYALDGQRPREHTPVTLSLDVAQQRHLRAVRTCCRGRPGHRRGALRRPARPPYGRTP
jgi:hypothetical protein